MGRSLPLLLLGLLTLSCERSRAPDRLELHAAASLGHVLPPLARRFEQHSGLPVTVQLDASSRLARQIEQGAKADVYLSANRRWVEYLTARGRVAGQPVTIAGGRLVLVVDTQKPAIQRLNQLPTLGRIATAAAAVPLGQYARQALRHHQLLGRVEQKLVNARNAQDALGLVASGKIPAGIVYRSDALREPRVRVVHSFAPASHQPIEYVAVRIRGGHSQSARMLQFLRLPQTSQALSRAGFDPPPDAAPTPPPPAGESSLGSPLWLSIQVALAALGISLLPGVLIGWLLARAQFRGKLLLVSLIYLPLVLPPVVTGLLLLELFGPTGPLGRLGAAFSFAGAVLAAAVVGFPLLVHAVRLSIEAVDPRYESLARSLGTGRIGAFWRVTLPLAWPGVLAGALLTTIRALGEFGATIVLAGNISGRTQTLSLAIYELLEQPTGERSAFILSALAALVAVFALGLYEWLSRRQKSLLAH